MNKWGKKKEIQEDLAITNSRRIKQKEEKKLWKK